MWWVRKKCIIRDKRDYQNQFVRRSHKTFLDNIGSSGLFSPFEYIEIISKLNKFYMVIYILTFCFFLNSFKFTASSTSEDDPFQRPTTLLKRWNCFGWRWLLHCQNLYFCPLVLLLSMLNMKNDNAWALYIPFTMLNTSTMSFSKRSLKMVKT